jgi:adenosylcobinamide kinase/adenosylcobinamide-phosphate guanylyltransferase
MALVLLVGGARSGKSSLAVRLAEDRGRDVAFIATAEARDDGEMAERIARHRAERPAGWETVEAPLEVGAAIEAAPEEATVIIDCLSLWISNLLEHRQPAEVEQEAASVAASSAARTSATIVVTNEVGLGIVPVTPLGRTYRDVLGRVNAIWADAADESYFVVAGKALRLGDV